MQDLTQLVVALATFTPPDHQDILHSVIVEAFPEHAPAHHARCTEYDYAHRQVLSGCRASHPTAAAPHALGDMTALRIRHLFMNEWATPT